ncbi:MAG: ATP-dependent Clp protease proteolytic subunit [Tissierellia bacterium]|nr:ATP-dependent Clp protease proteolytic subunit [Tissierellia bacterium]
MTRKINWDSFIDEETKEVGKINLPDPETLDYYKQLSNREIFINQDIDEYVVDYSLKIIEWNKEDKNIPIEDRKKIKIFINTDGGDVTAMNSMINAIQLSKTPCITIGMGKVFSAGAMILLASKERWVFKNTIVMIHKGSSGIISDVNKIIDYSKFLEKDNEYNKQYILDNTKITPKKYKEVENKDWYIFASECLEWGIATKIIDNIDDLI